MSTERRILMRLDKEKLIDLLEKIYNNFRNRLFITDSSFKKETVLL